MKASKNIVPLQIDNENTLIYHRWFGNPVLLDNTTYQNLISNNVSVLQNDEVLEDLLASSFIIENDDYEIDTFRNAVNTNAVPMLKGQNFYILDLIVSQRCNFGCMHCIYYAGNERSHSPETLMQYEIAEKSWTEYLHLMRTNNKHLMDVHFGGAEPLTNWHLIRQIFDTFPSFLKVDEEVIWSINTNLTLINQEILDYFKRNKVEIHTSLDGNQFANDLIRTDISGRGTSEKICKKIDLIYQNGLVISDVTTTITSKNFDFIDNDFVQFIKSKQISHLAVDIDLVGSPDISPEKAADKLANIYWYCIDNGVECSGTWLVPFLNLINKDVRQEQVAFCGAIRGINMTITPKGKITLCSYMTTEVGNINSINDLFLPNSSYQKLINERQVGRDPHCFGCVIEGFCGGQCHVTREVAEKDKNKQNIEKMCDFYRYVTTQMLRIYVSRS